MASKTRLLVAIALILFGSMVVAQAASCSDSDCTYVPLAQTSQSPQVMTPTWTPIAYGQRQDDCQLRGPVPAEGAQVWLTTYNLAPGDRSLVCMRLTVDSQPIASAFASSLIRYPSQVQRLGQDVTRSSGLLGIPFTVEPIAPLRLVVVEAEIVYQGKQYGATTQFLSQPVPTSTPTRTPIPPTTTPEPTNTPRPTNTPTTAPTSTPTNTPTDTPTP